MKNIVSREPWSIDKGLHAKLVKGFKEMGMGNDASPDSQRKPRGAIYQKLN